MSEPTSILLYQDGGLLDVVAIMLWIMASIVVAVGVAGLVISGVTPVSISGCLFLGVVAAMAAGGAALARSGGRAGSVLDFSETSLVARGGFPSKEVGWRSIRGVDLSRHELTEPFPRMLSVRPVNGLASDVVVIQPSRVVPPDALQSALWELLKHCPPAPVDPEVVLLLALARSVSHYNSEGEGAASPVKSFSTLDAAVRTLRTSSAGRVSGITAPFEYFLGNIEKARAQCAAGLSLEPNAWGLLLCRALCERSLGETAAYRESLGAALEASPPPEVAPVLAHALEVA